jgi:hypothetical protein
VDFSADPVARKKLIDTNPEWLKSQTDKNRYLSLRVLLRVLECFQLNVVDANKGLKFNFSD